MNKSHKWFVSPHKNNDKQAQIVYSYLNILQKGLPVLCE